jgi:hypothetical protein
MAIIEEDKQEGRIPELAVDVLTAASRRAAHEGRPLVLVKNGCLVRIEDSRITKLKQLPARKKVTIRVRTRSHE